MALATESNISLAVREPSYWHCGRTTGSTMQTLLLGLVPAAIFAILHWGGDALRVMALSVSACVIFEVICARVMDRKLAVDDFSAAYEGLLLAFLMPASVPWWLVIIGAAITILLAKMAFGGLGATPLCAPAVGWAALTISWPLYMDANAMALSTMYADPLVLLKYFGVAKALKIGYGEILIGAQIGALGAAQAGAILLGGIFILVRRARRFEITISFLAGAVIAGGIFYLINPGEYINPIFHLLTGSTLLCAFFLAPDPACAPDRPLAMIIYGLLGGVLVILIRNFGIYTDGAPFAVLLINLLTPQLAGLQPKPFGVRGKK